MDRTSLLDLSFHEVSLPVADVARFSAVPVMASQLLELGSLTLASPSSSFCPVWFGGYHL
jgi:hypothetical protein